MDDGSALVAITSDTENMGTKLIQVGKNNLSRQICMISGIKANHAQVIQEHPLTLELRGSDNGSYVVRVYRVRGNQPELIWDASHLGRVTFEDIFIKLSEDGKIWAVQDKPGLEEIQVELGEVPGFEPMITFRQSSALIDGDGAYLFPDDSFDIAFLSTDSESVTASILWRGIIWIVNEHRVSAPLSLQNGPAFEVLWNHETNMLWAKGRYSWEAFNLGNELEPDSTESIIRPDHSIVFDIKDWFPHGLIPKDDGRLVFFRGGIKGRLEVWRSLHPAEDQVIQSAQLGPVRMVLPSRSAQHIAILGFGEESMKSSPRSETIQIFSLENQ
jgi:hypothetical protein